MTDRMSLAAYKAHLAGEKRTNKYRARDAYRCQDCGAEMTKAAPCPVCSSPHRIRFPSRAEARRWDELRAQERRGEIEGLARQPAFPLVVNGREIGVYKADFAYRDRTGAVVVEDVKSKATMTEAAALRIKVAEAVHGIKVRLVHR